MAYSKWIEAEDTPQEFIDVLNRGSLVSEEYHQFMRTNTKEIVTRITPEGQPLTFSGIMDILHVYYWWNLNELDPVECLEVFLGDLDQKRFTEVTDLLHNEFPEHCYRLAAEGLVGEEYCSSQVGMECFLWYIELGKKPEETKEVLSSPRERASKLVLMFDEAIHGDDEDDSMPSNHNLRQLLRQHAVNRLSLAGADDIEAMDAIAVIDLEHALRNQDATEYENYILHRENGGDFENYVRKIARTILNDRKSMKKILRDFEGPGRRLDHISKTERKTIVERFIDENIEEFRLLETFFLLKEEGISPFYRRRMAEDNFPSEQRS